MKDSTDDIQDAHKAHRLINTSFELLQDATDREIVGGDADIVHLPRHLSETILFLLYEARDIVPLVPECEPA